mmetsp:Transcript_16959/g.46561  ORF Transcript_16959/g.46561 Transcript_16959/m.46561 type:complete len:230 (+) Transcript_16959:1215-1904(+)
MLSSATRVKSVTAGLPLVSVPVLSKTTESTLEASSSVSPPFMSTPCLAPTPVPTMTAVGVASPSAQGHEMTKQAMPKRSAVVSGVSPGTRSNTPFVNRAYQMTMVSTEMTTTDGTKIPATVSQKSWIGTCRFWASSTSCRIWLSAVLAPTPVTSTKPAPVSALASWQMVPPRTTAPGVLRTGRDSPVIMDSSMASSPKRRIPSVGTLDPLRILTRSPGRMLATGTTVSM